eukprot:SAG11_NODE_1484_length_4826_cov_4.020309_3_plen_135_part_00
MLQSAPAFASGSASAFGSAGTPAFASSSASGGAAAAGGAFDFSSGAAAPRPTFAFNKKRELSDGDGDAGDAGDGAGPAAAEGGPAAKAGRTADDRGSSPRGNFVKIDVHTVGRPEHPRPPRLPHRLRNESWQAS